MNSLLAEHFADITIAGSNTHLWASDLATLLSYRYIDFSLFPLSFKEFLLFRKGKATDIQENLKLFLRYGGLPSIHSLDLCDDLIFTYINSIYNTIVLKDVVSRNAIKAPAISGVIEHIVYLELLQRGYSLQIGKFDNLESDFIAQKKQ